LVLTGRASFGTLLIVLIPRRWFGMWPVSLLDVLSIASVSNCLNQDLMSLSYEHSRPITVAVINSPLLAI
jgi:hypothetical protein